MMMLVAVVPTVTTLIVITLLVVWLPRNWERLDPVVRWGCVAAVVVMPVLTTWQAWTILTRPETISWPAWVCWGCQFLVASGVIPRAIQVLKHDEDSR